MHRSVRSNNHRKCFNSAEWVWVQDGDGDGEIDLVLVKTFICAVSEF